MNRQEIIAAMEATAAEKPREVTIEGWGTLYVRAITVAEVDEQSDEEEKTEKVIGPDGKEVEVKKKVKNALARAAARLLCDENGDRVFDYTNDEHVALLAKQPWKMLQKVLEEPGEVTAKVGN